MSERAKSPGQGEDPTRKGIPAQPGIPTEPAIPGQPYVPTQAPVPVPPQPVPAGAAVPAATISAKPRYEPCEACGAPMDQQQRYCIECATRRGNGANPSSRYFAAMNKRARRPMAKPGARPPGSSRAAAVGFFALLPIAVAIGVVVGNSGSGGGGDEEALLQALREQDSGAATTTAAAGGAAAATGKSKDAGKHGKPHETKGEQTDHGTVHEVTNFVPSKQKEEEDTKLVETNPEQVGDNYIKAQQNLPDVVVVGGDPDDAPPLPVGAQP